MSRKRSMADTVECGLGVENHTEIEELKRRVGVLEKCKYDSKSTNGGSGTLQFVSIMLSIAAAVYGGYAWTQKDLDALNQRHISDFADIKLLSRERDENLREVRDVAETRTLSRLQKLEDYNVIQRERMMDKNETLQDEILTLRMSLIQVQKGTE